MILRSISIGQWFSRLFDTKAGEDITQVAEFIQPVISLHPKINIVRVNAYTTPTDKDFYLTNITLTGTHAAADTGTIVIMRAFVDGVQQTLLRLPGISLVAQEPMVISENYQTSPIKIDRGTAIDISATGTWTTTGGTIKGFTMETNKGT